MCAAAAVSISSLPELRSRPQLAAMAAEQEVRSEEIKARRAKRGGVVLGRSVMCASF